MPPSIIHQALYTLTVCLVVGSHALPVVFPSFNTPGFAYITDDEELVTIPAAFGHLLCSPSEGSLDFTPANKPCSKIVFFTSRNSVAFEFLNLSSNGVVQPIASTPQVMSSHAVLNLCWNVPNQPDEERGCPAGASGAQAPAEGPSSSQSEQGLDDDNLKTSDEDSAEVQLRRLEQDGSDVDERPALQGNHSDVKEANKTAGFLDSSGAVMPNYNFVVELYLEGLPEQELISLEFDFDDNITRSLLIYVDSSPVSVDIEQKKAPKEDRNEGSVRYELDVIFSTRIVGRPKKEALSCPNVTQPLDSLIAAAQFSGGQHSLTPDHLRAVVTASDALSTCPQPPKKLREASCVSIDSVNATFVSDEAGLDVCGFTSQRTQWTTVLRAEFSIEKGQNRNVGVTVIGDAVVSLFGMPVPRIVKTLNLAVQPATSPETEPLIEPEASPRSERVEEPDTPPRSEPVEEPEAPPAPESATGSVKTQSTKASSPSTRNEDSVAAMRKLGTALSGLTGAAAGLSFIASVGMPFLTFLNPAGGAALTSELGCLSSAVDLMQIGQRAYLMTKLAVPNLPQNFIAFGEQFAWTMLDFKDPWNTRSHSDKESDTSHSGRRRLLGNDTSSEDDDGRDDPYSKLRGTYFWTGIAMVCAIVVHLVFVVIFVAFKGRVPPILRVPRLELYLSHTFIAIVAEGPAYLFSGSTRQIFIGVTVLAVGVIPLTTFYIRTLRKYLFDAQREEKRIVYKIGHLDISAPTNDSVHVQERTNGLVRTTEPTNGSITEPFIGVSTNETAPQARTEGNVHKRWFLDYILSILFGRPYRSGKWTWRDKDAVRVIDRYGPVFEDYVGKPMRQTSPPQQEEDAHLARVLRREFISAEDENRDSLDRSEISYLLRISEKAICLTTQVFITILILGEDDPASNYQAAVILSIHGAYLLYLRVFRPYCDRGKLAVAMMERMLDTVSLCLVVCKLNQDRSHTHEDIGIAMTVFEVVAITIQLIDMAVTLWPILKKVKELLWDCKRSEGQTTGHTDFIEDPNDDGFEERWYSISARFLGENVFRPINEVVQSVRGGRRPNGIQPDENHEANGNGLQAPINAEAETPTD